MTADTITVSEVLELLDGPFAELASSVSDGGYVLWLGSGISRGRVIGLDGVIAKLLEYLRGRVTPAVDCRFRTALSEILDIAKLPGPDRASIDLASPVDAWPVFNALIDGLWNNYAEMLSVDVSGEAPDFLLWDALDFPNTFATQDPDVEHLAVAILILEGVTDKVATPNWDGLIEGALEEFGVDKDRIAITVTGKDLRNQAGALATFYKFHGCALRAIENEAGYRSLLVARSVQIGGWMHDDTFRVVRDQLKAVAQVKRSLMVGLSAQDKNIQDIFTSIGAQSGWDWSESPSAVVFSGTKLTQNQKDILALTYTKAWTGSKSDICDASLIPAYGKSLLPALVLSVLTRKLKALASLADAPNFNDADRARLDEGLITLRNRVAEAGATDLLALMRTLGAVVARVRAQIQDGDSPAGALPYFPISNGPAAQLVHDPAIRSTGQREAAAALAVVGSVVQTGDWTAATENPLVVTSGAVRISAGLGSAKIFFAANDHIIGELLKAGAFSETDRDAVIVCAGEATPRQHRSPSASYRGLLGEAKFVSFGPMMTSAANADALIDGFRKEVGL